MHHNTVQMPDGYLNKTPLFQFILLSCLFPLWGCAASLNDILITQFKTVFALSDFASALVQSAFYGGYFLIAIPASMVIRKTSYKVAIMSGLSLYIIGCVLFYPASHMATYTMFLAAIFAIAIGLSFLETAANTYSSMIGHRDYATLRLNISQTFYPIGALMGIVLGKYLVFQQGDSLSRQLAAMTPEQGHQFRLNMLELTLEPYKYLIIVLVVVLVLFAITRYPQCKPQADKHKTTAPGMGETLRYLAGNARFRKGIIAQFLYVGMQVAVWSFTIRLALNLGAANERDASNFMIYSFMCFFAGKFIANFLMTRFMPQKVLIAYSILGVATLAYVVMVPNFTAVYAAVFVSVLFGPCWATIYAGTLDTVDNKYTEVAGAIIVMAIVGAAVVPAIQGFVSDHLGSMKQAFSVSLLCFAYVGFYFWGELRNHQPLADPARSVMDNKL